MNLVKTIVVLIPSPIFHRGIVDTPARKSPHWTERLLFTTATQYIVILTHVIPHPSSFPRIHSTMHKYTNPLRRSTIVKLQTVKTVLHRIPRLRLRVHQIRPPKLNIHFTEQINLCLNFKIFHIFLFHNYPYP